jgi:uncharacterized iron-regulated membrane protein
MIHWHKVVGFYVAVPLFIIALTGAVFTFPSIGKFVLFDLTGETPFDFDVSAEASDGTRISIDRAISIARSAAPYATPVRVVLPHGSGSPMRVQARRPDETYQNGGTEIYLDPVTGEVLKIIDPITGSIAHRIDHWILHFHLGFWGNAFGPVIGAVIRAMWFLASFAAAFFALSGLWIWARKRSIKQRKREKGYR